MAAVQKRRDKEKEESSLVLATNEDDSAVKSKEALAKCMAKAKHMKRVTYKGGFSKKPNKPRKI